MKIERCLALHDWENSIDWLSILKELQTLEDVDWKSGKFSLLSKNGKLKQLGFEEFWQNHSKSFRGLLAGTFEIHGHVLYVSITGPDRPSRTFHVSISGEMRDDGWINVWYIEAWRRLSLLGSLGYGYAFNFSSASLDPVAELFTQGIEYLSGSEEDGAMVDDWMYWVTFSKGIGKFTTEGRFRNAFGINIINQSHLCSRTSNGTSLSDEIHSGLGALEEIGNKNFIWTLTRGELPVARALLADSKLLLGKYVHTG